MKRIKLYIILIYTVALLKPAGLNCQVLRDTATANLLKKCVDNIYNFRFDEARKLSLEINQVFPGHPVFYLLNGMTTYWENFPLLPFTKAAGSFETDLRTCIRICEQKQKPGDYAEFLLANLGARGLLLMYYADNDMSREVFPLATSTYRYLRQSFDYKSSYYDFYFFTGLYNYYREAYPEAHPVYKVLAVLFPKGNIETGLKELETAVERAVMLKAESAFFLSNIYINFENNYYKAGIFSRFLNKTYPGNEHYLAIYIKNLLLEKKFDEAESLILSQGAEMVNPFVKAQISILNGIIREKKYKDLHEAQRFYNKGITDMSPYLGYGDEIAAYAFFGLSRIADANNDKQAKRLYRKRALDLTDYKTVTFDD